VVPWTKSILTVFVEFTESSGIGLKGFITEFGLDSIDSSSMSSTLSLIHLLIIAKYTIKTATIAKIKDKTWILGLINSYYERLLIVGIVFICNATA